VPDKDLYRADLEAAILKLWEDEQLVREMGRRGIDKIRTSYSSEMIYRQWEHLLLGLRDMNAISNAKQGQ